MWLMSSLFAQGHDEAAAAAVMMVLVVIILISLAVGIGIMVMYMLTLSKALKQCAPGRRAMEPGMVFLLFIPLFMLIWHFIVVTNIAKSLQAEFAARGIPVERDPGKSIGMVMCIAWICAAVPFVNMVAGPVTLICWIMYWIKIAGFNKQLQSSVPPAGGAPQMPMGPQF